MNWASLKSVPSPPEILFERREVGDVFSAPRISGDGCCFYIPSIDETGWMWLFLLKIKSQNFATESQELLIDRYNLFYTANFNPGNKVL
jgi:hypothetical protein